MIVPLLVSLALVAKAPQPPLHRFLTVDARHHAVTITAIAAYNQSNNGFNFDGYSRYLMWTVPRGWEVHVVCKNRSVIRHSCAVVHGTNTAKPAFRGAETPRPFQGLENGTTARFSFRATKAGAYRLTCLVLGHEDAGMWDVLDVVKHGKPSIVDLRK